MYSWILGASKNVSFFIFRVSDASGSLERTVEHVGSIPEDKLDPNDGNCMINNFDFFSLFFCLLSTQSDIAL